MRMAVAIPVLLLVAIGLLLGWEIRELSAHAAWVSHTEEVKGQLFEAQKLLIDQETGLRGYLLLRDHAFLDPYNAGKTALPAVLGRLDELVADNPAQARRVGELRSQYQEWLTRAESVRTAAEREERPPLPDTLREELVARKRDMDSIRSMTGTMLAEEERLNAIRRGRLEQWTRAIVISTAVILLAFALVMATLLRRWIGNIDRTYTTALTEATEARRVSEVFANECLDQSRDFEARYLALSRDHEERS
jgi:CHASE3 domain sensor protein